jgi:hypothetical protein
LKADAVDRALKNERSQPDKLEYDVRYIPDEFYDKYNLIKDVSVNIFWLVLCLLTIGLKPGTPTKRKAENPPVISQKRTKTVDSGRPEVSLDTRP